MAKIFINFISSGAPAAQRAAKRSPIIIEKGTTRMHRKRNSCNSFLMVKMASGMDHGRVRPTTTTTNYVAQHGGHPAKNKSCSLGLQHISLILDMQAPRKYVFWDAIQYFTGQRYTLTKLQNAGNFKLFSHRVLTTATKAQNLERAL